MVRGIEHDEEEKTEDDGNNKDEEGKDKDDDSVATEAMELEEEPNG